MQELSERVREDGKCWGKELGNLYREEFLVCSWEMFAVVELLHINTDGLLQVIEAVRGGRPVGSKDTWGRLDGVGVVCGGSDLELRPRAVPVVIGGPEGEAMGGALPEGAAEFLLLLTFLHFARLFWNHTWKQSSVIK